MSDDAARLARYIDIWHTACADFVALARSLPEEVWDAPTDLAGWSVRDNLAHTAHLEAILAGAPEETVEVAAAPHVKDLMGRYTEQGVLARRDRTVPELADELETAVGKRYDALRADPPTDGSAAPPIVFGGVPWDNSTLLSNRPLDVWMHDQDVRRATGRPGGYDSPAAAHVLGVFARALPLVLGKRVAPPAGTSVLISLPESGRRFGAVVGDDGRARPTDPDADGRPTAAITLSDEAYVVLSGGRRPLASVEYAATGDADLAAAVLARLAVTP